MNNTIKEMDPIETELRKLRGHLAYKGKMEPFKVFTDKELDLLMQKKPRTMIALSMIKGFPADGERVKKYGAAIVSIFNGNKAPENMNAF